MTRRYSTTLKSEYAIETQAWLVRNLAHITVSNSFEAALETFILDCRGSKDYSFYDAHNIETKEGKMRCFPE